MSDTINSPAGTNQASFQVAAIAQSENTLMGLQNGQTTNFGLPVIAQFVQNYLQNWLAAQIATQVQAAIAAATPPAPTSVLSDNNTIRSDNITITSDAT